MNIRVCGYSPKPKGIDNTYQAYRICIQNLLNIEWVNYLNTNLKVLKS